MNSVREIQTPSLVAIGKDGASRKPRVLYLITRAERGGAQMHVLDLILGMRDDCDIQVATGEEGFLTESCRDLGIPVHVLPNLEREIKPLPDVKALFELRALMRRIEPDLVHAHTFKSGFLGRYVAKRLNIPQSTPFICGRLVELFRSVGEWLRRFANGWRPVGATRLSAYRSWEHETRRSSRLEIGDRLCRFSMEFLTTRHGRASTMTKRRVARW